MTTDEEPITHTVDELKVDAWPLNSRTRLLIEVAQNGFGAPVRVPVVVARGKHPGPVFGITAALHGNELNGIPLLHELVRKVNLNRLKGTIVAVIVANIPGLLAEQREFTDGKDLNHICLLYTSPSPRDRTRSRMPSSA